MKKANVKLGRVLVIMGLWIMGSLCTYAFDPIPLDVGNDDPSTTIPPLGKSPMQIPVICQDGNEIIFESSHADYTLSLVTNDMVIYSVYVPSSITSVILPSWLSGEYEIRLVPDDNNYYFYGYIEL